MKRTDLKPAGAVEEYNRLLAHDLSSMSKERHYWQVVDCPVCSHSRTKPFLKKHGFDIVKCANCDMAFVNPRPTEDQLLSYYATSKASRFFQECIIAPTQTARLEHIIKPRFEFICSNVFSVGDWLDIGCSNGALLNMGIKSGWNTSGIEFENSAIAEARELGIKVYTQPVTKCGFDRTFSLITLFEVLEHTHDPNETLLSCYRALKDLGVLIITVPNISGFEFEVMGAAHSNVCPPSHLNYYNLRTLRRSLIRCGFQISSIDTPGLLDIDNVRTFLKQGTVKSTNNTFLDSVLLGDGHLWDSSRSQLQALISATCNSGHLRVVATKTS